MIVALPLLFLFAYNLTANVAFCVTFPKKNIIKNYITLEGCIKFVPASIPVMFYSKWKKIFILAVGFHHSKMNTLPSFASPSRHCCSTTKRSPLCCRAAGTGGHRFDPNDTERKACSFLQVPFHQQPSPRDCKCLPNIFWAHNTSPAGVRAAALGQQRQKR